MQEDELIVVLCTAPDADTADRLAKGLVTAELAACVNVVPEVQSHYRWKGKLEVEREVQLIVKTRFGRFAEVKAWLEAQHPYDVPEVVALQAAAVNEAYGAWVRDETPTR
ncbi:MAG: divalent-cation tolerance protein CutA [Myxococcota bacterium]